MATTIDTESLFFGPGRLAIDGVAFGETEDAAKLTIEIPQIWPDFLARGKIKGTGRNGPPSAKLETVLKEVTASKLVWAFPGASATASAQVGQPKTGLDTTLAADPAAGATNLKVTSVTTVNAGDFVRVAPSTPTEANSEVVHVTNVGTAGGGGTGIDVVNDGGGGMLLDHENGEEVKTVQGTTLAAPAAAGDTVLKVAAVTGWAASDIVRVGYAGHYETRTVLAVGTAGPSGTGLTLDRPLVGSHAVGEWAIEVTALGTTKVTPAAGAIPGSAYHTAVLTAPGMDGVDRVITLRNALGVVGGSLDFGDEKFVGVPITFETTYDPENLEAVPFDIDMP